jgi:ATP-dependent DNA ligase
MLFAFDLLQLDGRDLRDAPFEARKAMLAKLLRRTAGHLQINHHVDDLPGRTRDWLKMKNPETPAVKREAEEDWGKGRRT